MIFQTNKTKLVNKQNQTNKQTKLRTNKQFYEQSDKTINMRSVASLHFHTVHFHTIQIVILSVSHAHFTMFQLVHHYCALNNIIYIVFGANLICQGKDSSNYSAEDMGCILGTKSEKVNHKGKSSSSSDVVALGCILSY